MTWVEEWRLFLSSLDIRFLALSALLLFVAGLMYRQEYGDDDKN